MDLCRINRTWKGFLFIKAILDCDLYWNQGGANFFNIVANWSTEDIEANDVCMKTLLPLQIVWKINFEKDWIHVALSAAMYIDSVFYSSFGLLSCSCDINPTSLSSSIIWCLGSSEFPCLLLLQSFVVVFNIVMSIWFKWAHSSMRLNRIPMSHKWSRTKYLVAHRHAWNPLKQIG